MSENVDPRLRALLGPAGPEITCEECFEMLDVFVDAEVAGERAEAVVPGMRSHLEGCPACHEDYESLSALVKAKPEN
jgi:hypothetical protein